MARSRDIISEVSFWFGPGSQRRSAKRLQNGANWRKVAVRSRFCPQRGVLVCILNANSGEDSFSGQRNANVNWRRRGTPADINFTLAPQQRQDERQPKQGGYSLPELHRGALIERPRSANRRRRSGRSRLHLLREFRHVTKPFARVDRHLRARRHHVSRPHWRISLWRPDAASSSGRDRPKKLTALRPDLPAWLEAVLARAIAVHPGERFRDMTEFAQEMETGPPRPPAAVRRPRTLYERAPVQFWQGVAALLGLALVLSLLRR